MHFKGGQWKTKKCHANLANKNQLNALSEMVLNVMKQNVPIQLKTIQKLKCYKNVLQELRLCQKLLKRKRELWQGFNECYAACCA